LRRTFSDRSIFVLYMDAPSRQTKYLALFCTIGRKWRQRKRQAVLRVALPAAAAR
jgi:hypothetical protein